MAGASVVKLKRGTNPRIARSQYIQNKKGTRFKTCLGCRIFYMKLIYMLKKRGDIIIPLILKTCKKEKPVSVTFNRETAGKILI